MYYLFFKDFLLIVCLLHLILECVYEKPELKFHIQPLFRRYCVYLLNTSPTFFTNEKEAAIEKSNEFTKTNGVYIHYLSLRYTNKVRH